VHYTIELSNYEIIKLEISDPEIQAAIDTQLSKITTNEVNLASVINSIFDYTPPKAQAE